MRQAAEQPIRTWFRGQDGLGHIVRPVEPTAGIFALCGVPKGAKSVVTSRRPTRVCAHCLVAAMRPPRIEIPSRAELSRRVRAERRRVGLTLDEVGERLGISGSGWGYLELRGDLRISQLFCLAAAGFDVRRIVPELFQDGKAIEP